MPTAEFSEDKCRAYIDANVERETSELVLRAVDLAGGNPVRALELGCGPGNDALTMLQRGFHVTVVDMHQHAIDCAIALADKHTLSAGLTTIRSRFVDLDFGTECWDLINARFALPFATPHDCQSTWTRLRASLAPGGVFSGQLFGLNDEWVRDPARREITGHTAAAVQACLAGWTIHHLEEVEQDGKTSLNRLKHWHVFHILAQRPRPRK